MSEIAQELSRRASPRYLKEQAKEVAVRKTTEWKDHMLASPLALGLLGGALGATIGALIGRGRRERSFEGPRVEVYRSGGAWREREGYRSDFDEPYIGAGVVREDLDEVGVGGAREAVGGKVEDLKAKAGEMVGEVKEGASQLVENVKEKASDVVENVREKIPSGEEIRRTAEDNPLLIALGGIALGAVAAMLLPVSHKERELLAPVKQRASEAINEAGAKLNEQLAGDQKSAPVQGYSGAPTVGDLPH